MKMNHKLLSIPPYISTSWKNIASLHVEATEEGEILLIVTLLNGADIEVPHLDISTIEAIFAVHAKFIDQDESKLPSPKKAIQNIQSNTPESISFGFPLQMDGEGVERFGGLVQHDSEQAHHPDLPKEILRKIAAISKVIGPTDADMIPKPEPHCNCPHCQIARAIHDDVPENAVTEEKEEEVTLEDLSFRTWDIRETSDKLYTVTNPLDGDEHYCVYLGEPIGCTCGQNHCEHIQAVLKS